MAAVPTTLIAQIGFATSVIEAVATSLGAGIVLGGYVAATGAMLRGRSRKEVERAPPSGTDISAERLECIVCFEIYCCDRLEKMGPRNIYIAIAVMVAIFFGGGLALRQVGGTAMQIVPIVGGIAGFVVLHALDGRDRRRERANRKVV